MKSFFSFLLTLFLLASLSPLQAQGLDLIWTYTSSNVPAGREVSAITPLNIGTDGSIAFTVVTNNGAFGEEKYELYWLKTSETDSSTYEILWQSGVQTEQPDAHAVRVGLLVYRQGKTLRSVTFDENEAAVLTTLKTYNTTDPTGRLVVSDEKSRAPGIMYAVEVAADKKSFILDAFRFLAAPPAISTVGTRSGVNSGVFELSFETDLGSNYQIQSSSDLVTWTDVGGVMVGNGSALSFTAPSTTGEKIFYRVLAL